MSIYASPLGSNPYKFSVYRNAAANSGNNAFAKVTFDTEIFDTNNNFATGTYTVPVDGFYFFSWIINYSNGSSDVVASLYKNGSAIQWGTEIFASASSGGSTILQCATNDTIEVYAYANATRALTVGSPKNNFSGFLVSLT